MRCVDLSIHLEPSLSEPEPVKLSVVSHQEGGDLLLKERGLGAQAFPKGEALSFERVSLTSHSGTHVDAPLHYGSLCEGQTSKSIDEIPLERFFGRGHVLHFSGNRTDPVSVDEIKEQVKISQKMIKENDIVLIHTGADKLWRTARYFDSYRGLSLQGLKWILDKGVKVVGIDSFSLDPPFSEMIDTFVKTGDNRHLWPCHMYGREKEYYQIERLAQLERLSTTQEFKVACFPIKLKRSGASWTRAVALIDEDESFLTQI